MAATSTIAKEIASDIRTVSRELDWLTALSDDDWNDLSEDYQDAQRIEWSTAVLAAERLQRHAEAEQMTAEQASQYQDLRRQLLAARYLLVARGCSLPRFLARPAA